MAYREFNYEKTYEAPDTSGFLKDAAQSASHAIANVFQSIHNRNEQKKQMANEYNYTLAKGISENDNIYFDQGTKAVTGLMREGIKSGDRSKINKAQELATSLEVQHQNMRKQNEVFKMSDDAISQREKEDKYYNGQPDRDRLNKAYHGADFDANHLTRGPELMSVAQTVGGSQPDTFKIDGGDGYQANYVKGFAANEKERKGMGGKVDTIYDKSPFILSNGKPGVSDQHAYDYLNSDPEGRVARYVENEVATGLMKEVKAIKAQGGDVMKPFKGMNDQEIVEYLKTPGNEKDNPINKTPFGKRVLDRAKERLTQSAGIVSKIDYGNANQQKKPWTNDHFSTWTKPVTMAQTVAHQKTTGEMYAPNTPNTATFFGGSLLKDDGKPIILNVKNPNRINIQSGNLETGNIGSVALNTDSYIQIIPKKNGSYIVPQGRTIEEREAWFEKLPYEHALTVEPNMGIGVTGYSINKASVIGDQIRAKQQAITTQIAKAKEDGDDDKVKRLQTQMTDLSDLTTKFNGMDPNNPNYDPDELLLAANANGVQIKNEYIYRADPAILKDIKGMSGGFSPDDPKYQSEEMKREQAAFKKWYDAAAAAGFKTPSKAQAPSANSQTITPESFNEKWSTLKTGEKLVGPDGIEYTKK